MFAREPPIPDINPYQSPAGARGYGDLPLRVGVWRDGTQIIIHPDAELPRYCIITGEPARYGYEVSIAWSYPIDISQRIHSCLVPLSARVHHAYRFRRRAAVGSVLASAALIGLAIVLRDWGGAEAIGLSILLTCVVAIVALYVYAEHAQLLYFAGLRGDYLCLKGANRPFLDRLPEWLPGG